MPSAGATSSNGSLARPVSNAASDDRYGNYYGSPSTGSASAATPANSIADARSTVGGGAAGGLPPASNSYVPGANSYTPAAGSVYSPAGSSTAPNATTPYPSTGAAPAASDSTDPAYRPGSTRASGDLPRNTSSLFPSSLGSNSSGSGVVSAGYVEPGAARN